MTLPTRLELGEILPSIVDLVGDQTEGTIADHPGRWMLSRLDGSPLDESMTLHENDVRDGDTLLLTTGDRIPQPYFGDLTHYVIDASSADHDHEWSRRMGAIACLWSAGFGATALFWPGHSAPSIRASVAAIVAVAATVAAIVASRVDAAPLPTLTLGVTAALFGAVAGFLAVPGGPAPPNFFLAATICSAVSTVLLQATSRGTTCFVALAAFSTMSAIVAAVVAMWPVPMASMGAVMAAASLAMLGTAAKLAILLTGLSPRMPSATDPPTGDETVPAAINGTRAEHGHLTLTGLLAGFSLSAALGVVLVAANQHTENAWSGVAFTGAVAATLIFRASQQHGEVRSTAVLMAGFISITASFTLAGSSMPQLVVGICVIAVAMGAGALCLARADLGSRLSPFARRGLEMIDYLSLAVVVPLACWVSGVFGFVRGLSLT